MINNCCIAKTFGCLSNCREPWPLRPKQLAKPEQRSFKCPFFRISLYKIHHKPWHDTKQRHRLMIQKCNYTQRIFSGFCELFKKQTDYQLFRGIYDRPNNIFLAICLLNIYYITGSDLISANFQRSTVNRSVSQ